MSYGRLGSDFLRTLPSLTSRHSFLVAPRYEATPSPRLISCFCELLPHFIWSMQLYHENMVKTVIIKVHDTNPLLYNRRASLSITANCSVNHIAGFEWSAQRRLSWTRFRRRALPLHPLDQPLRTNLIYNASSPVNVVYNVNVVDGLHGTKRYKHNLSMALTFFHAAQQGVESIAGGGVHKLRQRAKFLGLGIPSLQSPTTRCNPASSPLPFVDHLTNVLNGSTLYGNYE